MKTVNLNDRKTYYASDTLISELKAKNVTGPIVNLAYTDYGGSFFDKVVIAYLQEKHADSILVEGTSWYGQNAFVFGPIAEQFIEATDRYLLGFEGIEEYYSQIEWAEKTVGYGQFLEGLNADKYEISKDALDVLLDQRDDQVITSGLDYSERSLIEWCIGKGLIKEIVEAN